MGLIDLGSVLAVDNGVTRNSVVVDNTIIDCPPDPLALPLAASTNKANYPSWNNIDAQYHLLGNGTVVLAEGAIGNFGIRQWHLGHRR